MLIWQTCQKRVTKNPRKCCTTKKLDVWQTFCLNNFPWKDFLDTPNAFSTSPIEKICLDFRREKLSIRNEKKIKKINFLDKSFVHQNIPLDSWKAVRKISTKFFHQVSKRIHPMPKQFSHNVRENFKRWEIFCEKSCSLENPLEILIAVSRNVLEKLGQKSKKKVTQNPKSIENSWLLRTEVDQSKQTSAQKIGTFQNPGNEFPPDNKFFSAET